MTPRLSKRNGLCFRETQFAEQTEIDIYEKMRWWPVAFTRLERYGCSDRRECCSLLHIEIDVFWFRVYPRVGLFCGFPVFVTSSAAWAISLSQFELLNVTGKSHFEIRESAAY